MGDESWDTDAPTATKTTIGSESAPQSTARLGFGRGKPVAPSTTTTSDEPVGGSKWTGGGSSNSFNRSSNNDENQNPNSGGGGFNSFRGRSFENSRGGGGDRGGRGGRGGFDNGSGSFGSGNSGNSRTCYNCNQSGHMSRECPEPPKNNRGGFNSRGGGSGRGGFNSGSDENRGNGFQSFGNRNESSSTSGFRSGRAQDNNHDDKPPTNSWRASQNTDSSSSFSGGNGGFSSQQGGFRSGNRGDNDRNESSSMGHRPNNQFRPPNDDRKPRDGGSFGDSNRKRDVSDDIFDQPTPRGGDQPVERYIPPPPPTNEADIFGQALEKGENFDKYQKAKVKCSPENRIKPIDFYEEANLTSQVLSNIRRAHFNEPTPIQRYTIPGIQQQDDIMACAQTGSGKTAAFLLPIISNLLNYHQDELSEKPATPSPLCLILSPTRELALQTEREARKFAFQTPITPCSAIGGHDMNTVSDRLRDGCHILSATTGRLKDMVDKGRVSLKKVRYFVLDEADRMLDTGFEPDIRKLEELGLPNKDERVTSMFSATFPETVQTLAKHFLRQNYVFLAVGSIGGANEDIAQTIEEVPAAKKKDRLFQLLEENLKDQRCLIFVETKRSADYIGSLLSQKKFMSTTMHGDRTQRQRVEAVEQFTNGKCPVLVATSVAARGLDFPLIGYVVNYDLPDSSDFYIHRIGRTGRAGHLGKSISFFDPARESDRRIAPELIAKLVEAGQGVPDFLKQYGEGGSSGYNFSAPMGRNTDVRSQGTAFGSRNQPAGPGAAKEDDWD